MRREFVEKFGSVGAVLAALACPICFPKLALIGAAIGFGALAPFEGYVALGVQALFLVAFVGQLYSFRRHGNRWLLAVSAVTTLVLFAGYYIIPSSILLQVALGGLVVSSIWLIIEQRRCATCVASDPSALTERPSPTPTDRASAGDATIVN